MTIDRPAAAEVTEASTRPERMLRWIRFARWPAVILFYAVATVIQTWPVAKHPDNTINTWWFFPFDAWQFLWDLWWTKHALLHLQNPYHTDLLLYPQGSDLYLAGLIVVTGVMSMPVQLLTGNLILSWNLVALVSLVLTGLGTYLLAYRVTGNHLAGLLAGFIFAFSPMMMMRLGGHWNNVSTWPIPFLLLFLIRFRESGRMLDAILTGAFWVILTLNWIEFAVDATLFMGIFFIFWTIVYLRRRDRKGLKNLWRGGVVIAAVWAILSGPVMIQTIRAVQDKDYVLPSGDEVFSADVLTFVTPSPLWGPGTAPLAGGPNPNHLPVGSIENTAYMGGMPLLLATIALFTMRRHPQRLIWIITFVLFVVLSLGPYLYINDSRHHSLFGISFSIPMPYQIFDRLPFVGNRRVPVRMAVFAMISLSVLAAIGLDAVMAWLKQRWRLVVAPVVALLVLGVVWLEYWNPPVYVARHDSPAIFKQIGDEGGDFVVVHAPLARRNGYTISGHPAGGAPDMYYQTLHGKATVGGYISRTRTTGFAWFFEQPGLHYLSCPTTCGTKDQPAEPQGDDANVELVRNVFEMNHIRYVAVHRIGPDGKPLFFVGDGEILALDHYLRSVVGMEQIYADPGLSVYRYQS